MLAELERAYAKKEPVAVVAVVPALGVQQVRPHQAQGPARALGRQQPDPRRSANKNFPKKFPELNGWLKNFKMSEEELGSLEKDDPGSAARATRKRASQKWIDAHPGIVDKMAPVK